MTIISLHLYPTKEKFSIFYKSFQIIFTLQIEKIMNNENEKMSRNRKRRKAQKIEMIDDMNLLLNKIKSENKKKENLIKIKD